MEAIGYGFASFGVVLFAVWVVLVRRRISWILRGKRNYRDLSKRIKQTPHIYDRLPVNRICSGCGKKFITIFDSKYCSEECEKEHSWWLEV